MTDGRGSGIIAKVSSVKVFAFTWGPTGKGSCTMAKNLEISILLDYYGQMLTEKQLEVAQLYYNEDLSLAEIAQLANITRQGVRDSIKRAEGTLLEMEQRLGLARKFREYQEKLEQITSCAQEIAFEAQRYAPNRKIEKNAEKIVELAQQIEE